MESLILVAALEGPTMFARIGIMRALNRNVVRSLIPRARTPVGGDVGQALAHVHDAEIEIGKRHKPPGKPLHSSRCINGSTTRKTPKAPAFARGIR
jgi:hypothetical protein